MIENYEKNLTFKLLYPFAAFVVVYDQAVNCS